MNQLKLVAASARAAILTVIYVFAITVLAEQNPTLKTWLKDFSGHHWTSKGIFAAAIFLITLFLAYVLGSDSPTAVKRSLKILLVTTLIMGGGLLVFFYWHSL